MILLRVVRRHWRLSVITVVWTWLFVGYVILYSDMPSVSLPAVGEELER